MTTPPASPALLPVTDDCDTGGFWEAAAEGRLVVRACCGCGAWLHLPRAYCSACGSWDGEWREVAGTGRVHSWTEVVHQVHPAYPVPYTVVLVDLDGAPGVRLIGRLDGPAAVYVGQPMRVRFDEVSDGVTLPQWEPAPGPTPERRDDRA